MHVHAYENYKLYYNTL